METKPYADLFGKDIEDSLRAILNSVSSTGYDKLYVGIVEGNNDPEMLGRCKIRVPSIYGTDIPTDHLPWAIPDQTHIGSLAGSFIVPPIGALVHIYLKDGVIYSPHYTTKVLHKTNLPESRLEDYPDTLVFWESDNGGYLVYNRKKSRMEFRHDSGLRILMDNNGNMQIDNSSTPNAEIRLVTAGKVIVEAGTVEVKNDSGAQVTPNPLGGPFCALPSCLFSGAPHQGNVVKNCFVKTNDI